MDVITQKEHAAGTMKDLPVSERPYEKCRAYGPAVLSDAELLAVILRTGCQGRSAYDLAVSLLKKQTGAKKLSALTAMRTETLMQTPGIGPVKAVQLVCIGELARRLQRERARGRLKLSSPQSIADYFMQEMKDLGYEQIRAVFFDTKSNLICEEMLSRGTVNMSLITPREIFLAALAVQAVFVVLVHNHPSGDPTPSPDDLLLTRRVAESGALIGIELLDHIVIGDGTYTSLKEQGLFP